MVTNEKVGQQKKKKLLTLLKMQLRLRGGELDGHHVVNNCEGSQKEIRGKKSLFVTRSLDNHTKVMSSTKAVRLGYK